MQQVQFLYIVVGKINRNSNCWMLPGQFRTGRHAPKKVVGQIIEPG